MKADPERVDQVEPVAGLERRQPVSAAADAFVEELDARGLADPGAAWSGPAPRQTPRAGAARR